MPYTSRMSKHKEKKSAFVSYIDKISDYKSQLLKDKYDKVSADKIWKEAIRFYNEAKHNNEELKKYLVSPNEIPPPGRLFHNNNDYDTYIKSEMVRIYNQNNPDLSEMQKKHIKRLIDDLRNTTSSKANGELSETRLNGEKKAHLTTLQPKRTSHFNANLLTTKNGIVSTTQESSSTSQSSLVDSFEELRTSIPSQQTRQQPHVISERGTNAQGSPATSEEDIFVEVLQTTDNDTQPSDLSDDDSEPGDELDDHGSKQSSDIDSSDLRQKYIDESVSYLNESASNDTDLFAVERWKDNFKIPLILKLDDPFRSLLEIHTNNDRNKHKQTRYLFQASFIILNVLSSLNANIGNKTQSEQQYNLYIPVLTDNTVVIAKTNAEFNVNDEGESILIKPNLRTTTLTTNTYYLYSLTKQTASRSLQGLMNKLFSDGFRDKGTPIRYTGDKQALHDKYVRFVKLILAYMLAEGITWSTK